MAASVNIVGGVLVTILFTVYGFLIVHDSFIIDDVCCDSVTMICIVPFGI